MAQRNSSGRGATATRTKRQAGNQTPNTPGISESEISRMKVDDIRGQLRRRGVPGISALRKPELVKTLARTLRAEGGAGGAARRGTGPAGRAPAKKAAATKTTGARKATRAKAAPAPARKAAAPRKTTTAAARRSTTTRATIGAKNAPAKAAKSAPSRAKSTTTRAKSAPSRAKAAPARSASTATGRRTGRSTARSVRSSQLISSPADRPERPGRSLVTTNHEVIRNWARARGARPATIAGTERNGRPGVLTFEIPGYRESSRVQVITWDDWFRTFDARRLNLIYQEQLRDGRQSNFFRTESPDREDA
ncbi:hypothetical protein [Micromonospora halophytica]|uniref:Rho termination factor, N-terminal domain n=1 Tax=Micromonospora halophytica TaxID=47864 RepID=A0A1C5GS49_9ACTN|nr:hypothetical protein [Micromonospora halophytica]SCG35971.1 hypothetical protein GA0070560_101517 [Micromonospora halophytica]